MQGMRVVGIRARRGSFRRWRAGALLLVFLSTSVDCLMVLLLFSHPLISPFRLVVSGHKIIVDSIMYTNVVLALQRKSLANRGVTLQ